MIMLLPLLPLRLTVGGLSLVAIATINSFAAWNWPVDQPLTPWRRRAVLLSKELVLVTLWCLGFRIRVTGRENIKTAERLRAVAVFNHVSWVDAFVLVWLMAPSGVSKESNGHIPVIGRAVRALQTVYIPYHKLSSKSAAPAAAPPAAPPVSAGPHTSATAPASAAAVATAGDDSGGKSGFHFADRTSDDGSCSSGSGSSGANDSDNSGSSSGSSSGRSSSRKASRADRCDGGSCNGDGSSLEAPQRSADVGATAAAAGTLGAADGYQDSQTPQASSSSSAARGAPRPGEVVAPGVTEVLLRRVHHPAYCRRGGFPMLVMAPEGTTANGRGLLNFRTGAFVLGRPVLPICLRYRWRGLNPAWTIGDERWHFLRLMCQFRNDLEVEILPPYKPSQDELKDCRLFASHVRRLMGSVLGVPLVAASHDDYLQLRRRGVGVSWDGRTVTVHGARGDSGSA